MAVVVANQPIVRLNVDSPDVEPPHRPTIDDQPQPPKLERIRARMFKPTSRSDLQYMLDGRAKIVPYAELAGYRTLEELLEPYQTVILLYPSPNDTEVGHWVTFFVMPGTDFIQYFDSYGCDVDEPVGDYNEEKRREEEGLAPRNPDTIRQPRRIEPYFTELLLASRYADRAAFNETPFQSDEVATATCGLWCVARIKNNYLGEDGFRRLYLETAEAHGLDPDLLVSAVICDLYPEMCA